MDEIFFTDITTLPEQFLTTAAAVDFVCEEEFDDDERMMTTVAVLAVAVAGLMLLLVVVAAVARRRVWVVAGLLMLLLLVVVAAVARRRVWVVSRVQAGLPVLSTTSLDCVLSVTNDTDCPPLLNSDDTVGHPSFITVKGFSSTVDVFANAVAVFVTSEDGLTELLLLHSITSGLLLLLLAGNTTMLVLIGCCCFSVRETTVAVFCGRLRHPDNKTRRTSDFVVVETMVVGCFRGRPRPLDDTFRGISPLDDAEFRLGLSAINPHN